MNLFDWAIKNQFNAYYEECCKALNIDKYYTETALKEAYHKKVLECHPDKGGKTEDFIKVNESYKFLSSLIMDKPKVSKCKDSIPKYNSTNIFPQNKDKISMNNSNLNQNNDEKYEKDDKNDNKDNKEMNILNNKNKIKPKNVTYKLEIELSDAYFGSRKKIKINRNRICKKCSENNQLNSSNLDCEECNGKKYSLQLKEIQLIIKPGTYSGCKVTFKGEGEEYVGYSPGDIVFEFLVKENKNFLRKGSDIYIFRNISIGEWLGIDFILINLFDKVKFYVNKNNIVINPGEIKTIIGKGFPFYDNDTHSGNLHIKFNILFPSEINLDQKNIIKNTFEGKYIQYIRNNENNDINKNKNNNININKGNWKKNLANKKKNENGINQNKKTFAPKISNINKMKNKNSNNFFNNKIDANSNNQKPGINKMNENEKEKQNNINNLEILELVKYDETVVNKSYFYEKK
jgi:DnaJ-class molecular chaperone